LLPIGTRVAVEGVIIAALNAQMEAAYQHYNIRLPDGQSLSTNARNVRSMEAQAAEEEVSRQADDEALQETLNALLEAREAEHQAIRDGMRDHIASLITERDAARKEAEALRSEMKILKAARAEKAEKK